VSAIESWKVNHFNAGWVLAKDSQWNYVSESANGAFYVSPGRSPGKRLQRAKGLKARSDAGFETNSTD